MTLELLDVLSIIGTGVAAAVPGLWAVVRAVKAATVAVESARDQLSGQLDDHLARIEALNGKVNDLDQRVDRLEHLTGGAA